jgi:hypothetical protein
LSDNQALEFAKEFTLAAIQCGKLSIEDTCKFFEETYKTLSKIEPSKTPVERGSGSVLH